MAHIRKQVKVEAPPEFVWDALRDVGEIHTRLAQGFVVDTRLEDGSRIVTFGNGFVVRELIVDVNDELRRLAYSASSPRLSHHHASFQVLDDAGGGSQVIWIADVLPDEGAALVSSMMDEGCAAMKRTLEEQARVKPL